MGNADVSIYSGIAKDIADVGVTIAIAVVAVFFLAKVLDTLISQNKTITNSVIPRLEKFGNDLDVVRMNLSDNVSSHNTNANQNFHRIELDIKNINDELKHITKQIEIITKDIENIKAYLNAYRMFHYDNETAVTKNDKKEEEE